jgi:hypothetical protein
MDSENQQRNTSNIFLTGQISVMGNASQRMSRKNFTVKGRVLNSEVSESPDNRDSDRVNNNDDWTNKEGNNN